MTQIKFFGFILILLFVSVQNSFGQEDVCKNNFQGIELNCIKSKRKRIKVKPHLKLSTLKKNQIYFYETTNLALGKLKIKSVYASTSECLVYFDAVTYERANTHVPKNYLEIRKNYNVWPTESLHLETADNKVDLVLKYDKKQKACILVTQDATGTFLYTTEEDGLISSNDMLYWAAVLLIGLAAYIVATNFMDEEEKFKATENLAEAESSDVPKQNLGIVIKYSKPFFRRYFTPIVHSFKPKRKKAIREKYRKKLATAGLTRDMSPEDFFAMKLFLPLGFPILFLALRSFLEETWPLSIVPIISALGYYYPEIWINGKTERRKEEILMGMPFIVDMLALSVEAGLDFVAAMQKVIEKAPPSPLVEEFEQMIREIKIGSSRAEGLRNLSWRTDVLAVSSFTATLIAADSVGASIGPILKTLSQELRQKRSSEAEKKGATAATKILIPMMMFVMPSVLLVIMAPVAMQFMAGN